MPAWIARALATAFFLGFGGFFVFGGFQSVAVDLAKNRDGRVDATVIRRHFFGLYTVTARPTGVTAAVIVTRRGGAAVGRAFGGGVLTSGVVLRADSGDTPLFFGYSNVDESYRRAIARKLNAFITREGDRFSEVFSVRNVFGWVGLPFLLIGVVALFGWPLTALSGGRRMLP